MGERLYRALNLINGVDRYAPLIGERHLALGYSTMSSEVVLVLKDLRGQRPVRIEKGKIQASETEKDNDPKLEAERLKMFRCGFPSWVWSAAGIHRPGLAS